VAIWLILWLFGKYCGYLVNVVAIYITYLTHTPSTIWVATLPENRLTPSTDKCVQYFQQNFIRSSLTVLEKVRKLRSSFQLDILRKVRKLSSYLRRNFTRSNLERNVCRLSSFGALFCLGHAALKTKNQNKKKSIKGEHHTPSNSCFA
jgi:hypothetical protein